MRPVKLILHTGDGRKCIVRGDSVEQCLHWLIDVEAKGRSLQGYRIEFCGGTARAITGLWQQPDWTTIR